MSYIYYPGAVLGPGKTGLAIGYRVISLDGTVVTGFTTASVVETSVPGSYTVTDGVTLPNGFQGRIEWGTSGTKYAEEWINPLVDGMIAVPSVATGPAVGILAMVQQVWRRWYRKVERDTVAGTIKTFANDNATVLTTQAISTVGGVDTVGPAS